MADRQQRSSKEKKKPKKNAKRSKGPAVPYWQMPTPDLPGTSNL